jgi:hypothetical protein
MGSGDPPGLQILQKPRQSWVFSRLVTTISEEKASFRGDSVNLVTGLVTRKTVPFLHHRNPCGSNHFARGTQDQLTPWTAPLH